jgi:hypothetical protein
MVYRPLSSKSLSCPRLVRWWLSEVFVVVVVVVVVVVD